MNITLANHGNIICIDTVEKVVLAELRGEYVTWLYNSTVAEPTIKQCYWGHYFGKDVIQAKADFYLRSMAI